LTAWIDESEETMLTGLHFLLTYKCTFECDHCFVFGSPFAEGTFTLAHVNELLDQAKEIGTVKTVYFEGGEPFLFHPLLVASARSAHRLGYTVGIVTNAYFATTAEDAALWLEPLLGLGITDLSISEDAFHSASSDNPPKRAMKSAQRLGIPVGSICIEKPNFGTNADRKKGEPVVGGGVMFRGRAAERLTAGLPRVDWKEFDECPHEKLEAPGRVHVDPYGNVQLCQGLCLGNTWQTPLSSIIKDYDPSSHPIVSRLLEGGPAQLVSSFDLPHEDGYVDACHLCYRARQALIERFPQYLAPRQVYGLS
jgi:hypothetical protein